MKDLKDIKFWLFDLDNTLYDGATKVFDQVDKKMSKFISEKLNVGIEEARRIQKKVCLVKSGRFSLRKFVRQNRFHCLFDRKLCCFKAERIGFNF